MSIVGDDLQVARRAALAGAAVGMRWFADLPRLRREMKPDGSVVTEADRTVEAEVRTVLSAERPDDAVLGEEGGQSGDAARRWIIDPIDGTALFVAGDDRWLVLVALESDGEIVAGVAVIPAQRRVFWAERGGGAWEAPIDDLGAARRLIAGPADPDGEVSMSVGPADPAVPDVGVDLAPAVPAERDGGIRLSVVPLPSVAEVDGLLAAIPGRPWRQHPPLLVARGELDIAVQSSGHIWDFAATSLIVTEAGGYYRTRDGGTRPGRGLSVFARTPELAAEALTHLA
ncbi:inositol monophosphatase family protein [Actinoplanes sp. NPDC049265]|uniref:inositol monophosphatase family protein n=1 Tax=Actinoplanes sp. NPDC049265 TaxID=3363902 RepID=UPI00371942C7